MNLCFHQHYKMSTPAATSVKAIVDSVEPVVQKHSTILVTKIDDLSALINKSFVELQVQIANQANEISDLKKELASRSKAKPAGTVQADGTTTPAAKPFPTTKAAAFNFLYENDEAFRKEFANDAIIAEHEALPKKPKDLQKKIAKETFGKMLDAKDKGLPNKMADFDKIFAERRASKGAPAVTNLELDKDD